MCLENNRTEPLIATYLHQKGGRLGLAVSGTFELTARCNFNCPMCYVHLCKEEVEKKGQELSAKQWISLAEQARDAGMMFALLTGGEPLLRSDFFEIYGAMKDMGLMISVNSNGSLIKGENLRRFIDDPPFRMNISLYGGDDRTYRNMCKADAFDQVINCIRALKEAGVEVRLNLSLTPYNCEDMEKIFNISKDLGVHIKCNTYMYPPLRKKGCAGESADRFTPEEAAEYTMRWEKLRQSPEGFASRCKNILNLSSCSKEGCIADVDENVRCRAGRSSFWISWDGKMLPCGMMKTPAADPVRDGFLSAWELIKEKSKDIHLPMECMSCSKRKICNHCAAVCVTETGTFGDKPEYMCRYSDALVARAKMYLNGE